MSIKLLVELSYPFSGCRVCSDGPGFIPDVVLCQLSLYPCLFLEFYQFCWFFLKVQFFVSLTFSLVFLFSTSLTNSRGHILILATKHEREILRKIGQGGSCAGLSTVGLERGAKPQVSFLGKRKVLGIRSTLSWLHPRPWHTVFSSPVSESVPTQLLKGRDCLGARWAPRNLREFGSWVLLLSDRPHSVFSCPVGFRIRMKLPL